MAHHKIEMFHQNRIDLDREIQKHPELIEVLKNQEANEVEMRIAVIAMYCDVVLHGDYTPLDLDDLCGVLYKKLIEKRVPLILS